jgi:hypothetical protein
MSTGSQTQSDVKPAKLRQVRRGLPFRWMFPLGEIVLCAILLWPARPRIAYEIGLPMTGRPLPFQFGGPMQAFARWSDEKGVQTVAAINFPAVVFEAPLMLFQKNWENHGVDYRVGRAIAWPILAMVFWWIAGRGAEALAAARRRELVPGIGWVETVIGFLLLAGGITILVGVEVFSGDDRHALQLLAAIGALWGFLGGLSVAAKVVQWRLRRRLSADHGTGEILTTLSAGGPTQ